jgi:two-component system, LytTR family, response regulator
MTDPRAGVLIVDDEPVARRGLKRLVSARPELRVVGESRNGREAVTAIRSLAPDVVLLDLQMPGLDGIGVVRAVGADAMPPVVFVTAYDDGAVRAFDVAAVDYVVKPFTDARLYRALDRALARRGAQRAAGAYRALLDAATASAAPSEGYLTRVLTTAGRRTAVVPIADVLWIAADDYCVRLVTGTGRYVLRERLTALERRLDPAMFVRVHRSAIVRIDAIRALERSSDGRVAAVLSDGARVPVGRARQRAVFDTLSGLRG